MPQLPGTKDKSYLGDGVYVQHDGYSLWITTENGVEISNTICLEPDIVYQLIKYGFRKGIIYRDEAGV